VSSSRRAIEIAEGHEAVLAATGIHPHEAGTVTESQIDEIEQLSHHPRVVAIGEIGLDFYRDYAPRDRQLDALRWQLHVATRRRLPVILHARGAHEEMLDVLTEWLDWRPDSGGNANVGVIHCFMGDAATARRYLDMGFMISLAGYVSYPQPVVPEEAVRSIPADRLMAETDCPYLAPQPYRGRRNEPAYVRHTVQTLADIRGVSFEALARETSENARRLFGW
jgi:TatD DNase family protein